MTTNVAETCAKRYYEIYERIVMRSFSYSKTSLVLKKWEELTERSRLQRIDAFRELLTDPEFRAILKNLE